MSHNIEVNQSEEDAMAKSVPVEIMPAEADERLDPETLVYWLEKLDSDTYKRVIRSSRLRRKGNEALNGGKNGK